MIGLIGSRRDFLLVATAAGQLCALSASAKRPDGHLELAIVDAETGDPLAARIHLTDARGRAAPASRAAEPWGTAALGDHAYVDGTTTLGLRRGAYRFLLDAGPEYRTQHGHFEIVRHAEDSKTVEVRRHAQLADEGWFAADLASHRPADDADLLHRAEQLTHTPPLAAVWQDDEWAPPKLIERRRRDAEVVGANVLWSEARGAVWLMDPDGSRAVADLPTPGDSSVTFLQAARKGGWRVVASITSRELPLWIAHELVDAVVVIDGWAESPAGAAAAKLGRQPDQLRFPGEQGPGRWRRYLYESLIETGVRLPPVALSGSSLNTSPLGSSRVYAFTDGDSSAEAWWDAADDLSVVVTNGPLLRPFIGGTAPGETFLVGPGETRTFSIALNLATRTTIDYLEIVKDGRVARNVRLADVAAAGGRLPEVTFDAAGWLAIAAVTIAEDRYELALSAPWFVEDAKGERISQPACEAWQAALAEASEVFGNSDPDSYEAARTYWLDRLASSTPETP